MPTHNLPAPTPQPSDPESHLPPDHWPLPELTEVEHARHEPAPGDYAAVQASPEFAELKRRFRTFAFPLSIAFLAWYFLYVLLSMYAVDFMKTPLLGHLNWGLFLGLLQFVTTFGLTALYIRHANKNLDPLATQLRDRLEGGAER